MSWVETDQSRVTLSCTQAPVSVALAERKTGAVRLWLTLSPETRAALGWPIGQTVGMDVGTGALAGKVRVRPAPDGRRLRVLPKSDYTTVELMPPDALAGWTAPRMPAEHQVLKGGILVLTLPWELPVNGAAEAEAA